MEHPKQTFAVGGIGRQGCCLSAYRQEHYHRCGQNDSHGLRPTIQVVFQHFPDLAQLEWYDPKNAMPVSKVRRKKRATLIHCDPYQMKFC
jgi:hypothetical protein